MFRILFFDFCGLLLFVILLTQIIMPLFVPKHFHLFWLFRKGILAKEGKVVEQNTGDDLRDQIKVAIGLKKKTDAFIKDVHKKTKENLDNATSLNEKVKNL